MNSDNPDNFIVDKNNKHFNNDRCSESSKEIIDVFKLVKSIKKLMTDGDRNNTSTPSLNDSQDISFDQSFNENDKIIIYYLEMTDSDDFKIQNIFLLIKHLKFTQKALFEIFQLILYQDFNSSRCKYQCLSNIFVKYSHIFKEMRKKSEISLHLENNSEYSMANIAWEELHYNFNDRDDVEEIKKFIIVIEKQTNGFLSRRLQKHNLGKLLDLHHY